MFLWSADILSLKFKFYIFLEPSIQQVEYYPILVIGLFVRTTSSVIKKLVNFVVKESHILKLESKQKIKKLKEDPRNVLVWEEQDGTDQKKISEQTKNILSIKRNSSVIPLLYKKLIQKKWNRES